MSIEEQPAGVDGQGSSQNEEPVTHCPTCKRKLLTQTSAFCNWCGAKISDPNYQERAAQTRQAADSAERARIEAIVLEESRYGVLGRLKRRAKGGQTPSDPLG